ncbi:MAG TPA: Lrp/AsnC family transcriptional regulator [Candidatus Nanoarchaeia archaeon]|nr:Lrp/AsnC family transcriptional regulator [Candidatus Nanoarchaeia archaeon]
MVKITKYDLKLLAELEEDSRQTLSQIAKKLNTSQQVISYKIKSLEKNKIIGGYYTIINLTKLGYTSYRTMIRLSNINEQKYKEIIDYLIKNTNVLWLVDCGGRWDLLVNFMAKNIIQYDILIKEFKNKFPKQIQNYDVLTTIEVVYFGRDYFIKKREIKQHPYFGREFKSTNLDQTNLKILNLISENARMNAVEISQKINTSPNTVISRIKEMKKHGVIQGFKPLIHLENTNYSGYKSLIKFQNITEEKEKEVIDFLKINIHVVGMIKLVGLWDFEIEFEVENKEQMLEFTRNLRDKFKEVIKEFEVIPLFHEYRYNFFPKDLLN